MFIDAKGKQCPLPVIMAKKAIDEGNAVVTIVVDNDIAVQNLTRLANSSGYSVNVTSGEGEFTLVLSLGENAPVTEAAPAAPVYCGCGYAVFIGKNYVGEGNATLGGNLLRMALYALSEGEDVPASVLFMNSGVFLPAGEDEQVIASINRLVERGCEVLVCGTCLDFYGLKEKLRIGTVSNMYDILGAMKRAAKVITL